MNYMDALRGVLMSLGVIYHSALIFMPGLSWRVAEPQKNVLLGQLAYFIHMFRMPAFFLISGCFCALLIRKYGENGFLHDRAQRIAVPLFTTAVLINPLMNFISTNRTQMNASDYFLRLDYFFRGEWIAQLWFLNDLLVFYFLCFIGVKVSCLTGFQRFQMNNMLDYFRNIPTPIAAGALVLALPAANAVIARIFWHLLGTGPVLIGIIDPDSLCRYLPYFAFGFLMWHSELLSNRFVHIWFWLPALALAFILLSLASTTEGKDTPRYVEYAGYLAAWGMASICLAFFKRYFNQPSRGFRYLSDASYTIYLVHMLFIVSVGSVVAVLDFSSYAKFAIVAAVTTAASLAFHHFLVRRVTLLALLFNGRWRVKSAIYPKGVKPDFGTEATSQSIVAVLPVVPKP